MQTESFQKMDGEVEVDETFIGGKARNMHWNKRKAKGSGSVGKVAVMGLLARHGEDGSKIRTRVLRNVRSHQLVPEVRKNVEVGAEVFTDAFRSYGELGEEFEHKVINHAETYVRGNVHTNGIENFWSLLKRAIKGTYVSVEPFHLFRYLDEQTFRFNERKDKDKDNDRERFLKTAKNSIGKHVTYAMLTGKMAPETT